MLIVLKTVNLIASFFSMVYFFILIAGCGIKITSKQIIHENVAVMKS